MNTPVENRIVSLMVTCGPNYPAECPSVKFQSKVNFPFVKADGVVDIPKAKIAWDKTKSIEYMLSSIKQQLGKGEHKKLPQPPDGATYD